MTEALKKNWVFGVLCSLGLGLLVGSRLLDSPALGMAGLGVVIPLSVYFFLYRFSWLYYFMVISLPISIQLDNVGLGIGLSMPGEILLILVLIGVVWRMIFRFETYKPIVFHPVSLLILAHLLWILFSSISSVLVSVSLKFMLVRIAYVLVFYVYGVRLFIHTLQFKKTIGLYVLGLVPVLMYAFIVHSEHGFSVASSNRICYPFFNDHTIYAACIAMLIPVTTVMLKNKYRWVFIGVSVLLGLALYFSFSRAGWLSLVASLLVAVPILLRVHFRWFLVGASVLLIGGGGVVMYQQSRAISPKEASTQHTQVGDLVTSMMDTQSNHSNTERLNRWKSAFEMFKDKPLTGFGPGTFMFVYGRFQSAKTFISVSDASMGGAHSEYLKPLSEQGLMGLVLFLGIVGYVFFTGYRLGVELPNHSKRLLVMACVMGLTTYYIHGVFNFFLDTDKSSFLFWGLTAFVVAQDLREKGKIKTP